MSAYANLKYIDMFYLIFGVAVLIESAMAQWEEFPSEYDDCHDDVKYDPEDFSNVRMRFPWLAFLQYLLIKDGRLYHGRVPRVVMVHRQYVLATASDVTDLPEGYSLGNIVFKNYDRDEAECGVTRADVRAGAECNPSELVMPIVDVILHPEYLDVDNRPPDSIAIVKMMQRIMSDYMVPICLPTFDFLKPKHKLYKIFIVDFHSKMPNMLSDETKYSQKLHILPKQFCNGIQNITNVSRSHWPLALCTSGCGMSRGAPLVSHLPNGWWVLVALTSRPVICVDPNVWRSSRAGPNLFVSVLPYVDWITNITTGQVDPRYTLKHRADDPFGYNVLQSKPSGKWIGRVYRSGACSNKDPTILTFHYYKEVFGIKSDYNGDINYILNLQPDVWYKISCVKVDMPSRLTTPIVIGVGHWNLSVVIPGIEYRKTYEIIVDVISVEASATQKVLWREERTKQDQLVVD